MSDKNFMAMIAIIVVAVVGSIIMFGGSDSASSGAWIGDPLLLATGEANGDEEVQAADHYRGAEDPEVVIIEYADFECPACFGFAPQLQIVEANYEDEVQVIFRHNPLSSLHPNAFAAHRAAEAAGQQDKFWEMHDILFERQPSWSAQQSGLSVSDAAAVFEGYAEEIGLDMDKFRADVESEEVFDYIDSHLDSGSQLGVTGTPTIFLNGEEITERSAEELGAIIDQILADNNSEEGVEDTSEDASDETEGAEEEATEN